MRPAAYRRDISQKSARMSTVSNSDDCNIFAKAMDLAWQIFLKTGRLTNSNIDVAKAALAYAMLESAEKGERHPRRLAIAAVGRMARYESKLRLARSATRGLVRRALRER